MKRRPSILLVVPLVFLAALASLTYSLLGRRPAEAGGGRAPARDHVGAEVGSSRARVSLPLPFLAPSSAPAIEAPPGERRDNFTMFKERFETEAPDPEWSARTAREIREVVSELALAGTTLLSARCARTVCLVAFEHASAEAQTQAPFSLTKGPFAHGVHYRYDGLRTTAAVQHE